MEQRWLDDEQQRTWRAWLTLAELLPRTLDAQLQRDAGISHAAYIVLAMLSEAPDRSRRMSDLARRANQSQSRLSHTVARLEERGWVRRERSPRTAAAHLAVLTDAGWDVVRRWRPATSTPSATRCSGRSPTSRPAPSARRCRRCVERLDPDHSLAGRARRRTSGSDR